MSDRCVGCREIRFQNKGRLRLFATLRPKPAESRVQRGPKISSRQRSLGGRCCPLPQSQYRSVANTLYVGSLPPPFHAACTECERKDSTANLGIHESIAGTSLEQLEHDDFRIWKFSTRISSADPNFTNIINHPHKRNTTSWKKRMP